MDKDPILAREKALLLLGDVLDSHRSLDESFDGRVSGLESRDRAFVRLLVATTLRRLGQIDDILDRCLNKPLHEKAYVLRNIMRLGACQILFLETPPHAAVDTSVRLAEARKQVPFKNLVNAILRRITREGAKWVGKQRSPAINTPEWLWKSWVGAYGEATARLIATAHLTEAPLDITLAGDVDDWAETLEAEVLPTGSLRRAAGGRVEELPGFEDGAWWVQDAAAALPARLFGDVAGLDIADLCAAPGGKSAQLASAGANVLAVDRSERRLELLQDNMARLGLSGSMAEADVTKWEPDRTFDAVLLDAPCSATGTIRRHPDVPRLKNIDDAAKLAKVQASLLKKAVKVLKPGGTLIYCVCSLQPEEGPGLIGAALAGGMPLERLPITADEVGGLEEVLTEDGDVRTLPCHLADKGGMDGFFIARLRKTQ